MTKNKTNAAPKIKTVAKQPMFLDFFAGTDGNGAGGGC